MSDVEFEEKLIICNAITSVWTLFHTNALTLRDWCWVGGRREA